MGVVRNPSWARAASGGGRGGGGRGRQQCAVSTLLLLRSHGRKKEEYLVYMDMVSALDGSLSTVSRRRQPGERNCTRNFVLCFCLIFFRASKWGDRASSRGLVLRLGLRHRRSDPIVITDGSSSLCVHGPPGSIRWAELVCGRFSAAPTNSRRGGDTAPSYDSSERRTSVRVSLARFMSSGARHN